MKGAPALKSSLFVAILAGLLAFPFSGFGLMKYSEESPVIYGQTAAVLGATTLAVRSNNNLGDINVVDQEDMVLNLSGEKVQKFYNVVPEQYVSDQHEIIVVVPNEVKEAGLTAKLKKSDLSYDLEIEIDNPSLEFNQVNLSLLVITK